MIFSCQAPGFLRQKGVREHRFLRPPVSARFHLSLRSLKKTMVKAEISPRCCRNFTMVVFPLHHGGVFTAPRWSFYGTMVEWHRHRGVFPDFTMVKIFLHHGEISKKCGSSKSPWWRNFELGLKAFWTSVGGVLILAWWPFGPTMKFFQNAARIAPPSRRSFLILGRARKGKKKFFFFCPSQGILVNSQRVFF